MTTAENLERFSKIAWNPGDLVEVRAFPPKGGAGVVRSLWVHAADLPIQAERLEAWNAGLGIHAGVLPRRAEGGGKDVDCLPGRVVWTDFDDTMDLRAPWRRAVKAGLPKPSAAVASGHGVHLYWRLFEARDPAELAELVRDLAALLGSDPAVGNPSRVMRLPGFMNHKKPAAPCRLLYAATEGPWPSFEEIRVKVSRRPPVKPAPPMAHPAAAADREGLIERARRYAATIPGAPQGGRNAASFKVAAALVNDFSLSPAEAAPILESWNMAANTPPLDREELGAVLRSARRYAKHPPARLVDAPRPGRPPRGAPPSISPPAPGDEPVLELVKIFEAEAAGERVTLPFPWPRLTDSTRALRPGTVTVVAGGPGLGKSFFCLEAAVFLHRREVPLAYLPLEDTREELLRRVLAHVAETWHVLDDDRKGAKRRAELLVEHETELESFAGCVAENPRLAKEEGGRLVVPPLPWRGVLDFLAVAARTARVLFLDPMAQVDFGARAWEGQGDFIRGVAAVAAHSGASIVLVVHTIKRPGAGLKTPLTLADVQGAAEISRLCHTVLLLDAHDMKESDIWRPGAERETVEHNRTIYIEKARNGRGRGLRLAFRMELPRLEEIGIIATKKAAAKRAAPREEP